MEGEKQITGKSVPFAFKQFQVIHGGGTWKIGTDSVLLGSWCRLDGASHVLDMGTGTGVLALMVAQRSADVRIDAVDILPEAIAEAKHNVLGSKWKERITVIEQDLMIMDVNHFHQYDVAICNPPYYPEGIAAQSESRQISRRGRGFSLWDVPRISNAYLRKNGRLCVVIPAGARYRFIEKANEFGLHVHRKLSVKHTSASRESIVLFELGYRPVKAEHTTLVLYQDSKPSQEYIQLCSGFIAI